MNKKLLIAFLFLLIFLNNLVYSVEVDLDKDLILLKTEDKNNFLKKCKKNKEGSFRPECLNFLGIKIFLVAYNNKNIDISTKDILFKKSINYLEFAAKRGSKHAFKNLGWIYSNNNLSFFDLEKSSLYFNSSNKNYYYEKKILDKNKKKNTSNEINYSNIILAMTLIKKVEIYFNARKNKKNKYLTEQQFKEAKKNSI